MIIRVVTAMAALALLAGCQGIDGRFGLGEAAADKAGGREVGVFVYTDRGAATVRPPRQGYEVHFKLLQ